MESPRLLLSDAVARELSGEKVLWSALPSPWGYARNSWKTALFGVPFTLFAIFWTVMAATAPDKNGEPVVWIFPLCGLPFVVIGLSMLLAPFFRIWTAARVYYVVTERRAIIFAQAWKLRIQSFDASGFGGFERNSAGESSGDIVFQRNIQRRGKSTHVAEEGFIGLRDFAPAELALRKMMTLQKTK